MKVLTLAVLVPLLASCTSMGLYNMSDDWCAAHVNASAARCPQNEAQRRVAANETKHAEADAAHEVASNQ
jgi:hypothetical protein